MSNSHGVTLEEMAGMILVGQVGMFIGIFSLFVFIIGGQFIFGAVLLAFALYFIYRADKRYTEIIRKLGLRT